MTADNFIHVLTQNAKKADGKVLGSDENSTVFIYYSGPSSNRGTVDMPDGNPLFEVELINALKEMK